MMQHAAMPVSSDGQGGAAAPSERMSRSSVLSRCDILNIVRKHSDALPRPSGAPELPAARAREGGAGPASQGPPRPWATGPKGTGAAAGAWRGEEDSPCSSGARDSSLGAPPGSRAESPAAVMDPRYWKEMLSMYFVCEGLEGTGAPRDAWPGATAGPHPEAPPGSQAEAPPHGTEERGARLGIELQAAPPPQHKRDALFDDMLFFVRHERSALGQFLNFFGSLMSDAERSEEVQEKAKPYFVRRWGSDLDRVVGESARDVDWRRSYYLNLICHTEYSLTVAICRRQDLENHRRSHKAPVPPLYKVTKRVYASPSKARIDMDTSKAQETLPSYPDICFAVDDYDNTFEAVVLEHPDHCFCVLLNAYGGAAFPPEDASVENGNPTSSRGGAYILSRGTSSEARALGEAQEGVPKITLFSGFVSYPMVRVAFQGGGGPGFSLFGPSTTQSARAEKLVMRGPGGRGEAEVAVMGVTVPSCSGSGTGEAKPSNDTLKRPVAMHGGSGSRKASMEELQAKLWSVQQQLMAVIQQQQQQQQLAQQPLSGPGRSEALPGLRTGRRVGEAQGQEEAQARQRVEEERQRQLQQLQEELQAVQEQLQQVQQGRGSPKRGASPQQGPADRPGSPLGSGVSPGPGPHQSGAANPSPGTHQGGTSAPSPGTSSSAQGFRKRASGAPPRRAMVHHEDPQGPAGPGPGSGASRAGVTRHKAQMQQQEHVQPLRCCLMSLSLPWDLLAFDLLFKETPIKVDISGRVYPPARP